MVEQLDGKCGRVKAQVGKAKKQACIYSYANNDDYMLGIADRLDILEVILPILISEYNMPSADELIHFKDYYINKVNMFRNRLGHVKLGEQVLHIQGKDVPIDQALHRMLRKISVRLKRHCSQSKICSVSNVVIEQTVTFSMHASPTRVPIIRYPCR